MQFDLALYLPLAALILGGLYHSLSDDGAASILDHFGIAFRMPPRLLPVSILLVSVAAGIVDAKLGGADWQHALVTALSAAFAGIFGAGANHAMVNKTSPQHVGVPAEPPAPPPIVAAPAYSPVVPSGAVAMRLVAGAAICVTLALAVGGCTWFKAHEAEINSAVLDADQIACIFAGSSLDANEQALACKIPQALIPELLPVIEGLIGQREAARKQGIAFRLGHPSDAGAEAGK